MQIQTYSNHFEPCESFGPSKKREMTSFNPHDHLSPFLVSVLGPLAKQLEPKSGTQPRGSGFSSILPGGCYRWDNETSFGTQTT